MRGQRKNPRKAVQPFENKKRKIDIFKNYEANGVEKIQRKLEIFSTLISKKSILILMKFMKYFIRTSTKGSWSGMQESQAMTSARTWQPKPKDSVTTDVSW